jgi:hypothetical protein
MQYSNIKGITWVVDELLLKEKLLIGRSSTMSRSRGWKKETRQMYGGGRAWSAWSETGRVMGMGIGNGMEEKGNSRMELDINPMSSGN